MGIPCNEMYSTVKSFGKGLKQEWWVYNLEFWKTVAESAIFTTIGVKPLSSIRTEFAPQPHTAAVCPKKYHTGWIYVVESAIWWIKKAKHKTASLPSS